MHAIPLGQLFLATTLVFLESEVISTKFNTH